MTLMGKRTKAKRWLDKQFEGDNWARLLDNDLSSWHHKIFNRKNIPQYQLGIKERYIKAISVATQKELMLLDGLI